MDLKIKSSNGMGRETKVNSEHIKEPDCTIEEWLAKQPTPCVIEKGVRVQMNRWANEFLNGTACRHFNPTHWIEIPEPPKEPIL